MHSALPCNAPSESRCACCASGGASSQGCSCRQPGLARLPLNAVEQIDEAIARLEERVNHSTLSLNEEKRILEDIKKLKQSRASVGQYSDKLSQLAQVGPGERGGGALGVWRSGSWVVGGGKQQMAASRGCCGEEPGGASLLPGTALRPFAYQAVLLLWRTAG